MVSHSEILELLPHRYPFLLVDRITSMGEGRIVGIKNVTFNEPCFQGHFPEHPVFPGVLIIESMAQVACIYAKKVDKIDDNKITLFAGIDKAKFRKPVYPGDVIEMEVTLDKCRRGIYFFKGISRVEGNIVAEAYLKATFVDK